VPNYLFITLNIFIMSRSKQMAEYIQAKKDAAALANRPNPLHKGTLVPSYTGEALMRQTKVRNKLESFSNFKKKVTRGLYVSDSLAAVYGV
jgi:hypothetical protein